MAYRKPSFFPRCVFDPIAMRFELSGTRALAVRGRPSGRIQRVPVIPIEHDGARYLVSPRGETSHFEALPDAADHPVFRIEAA